MGTGTYYECIYDVLCVCVRLRDLIVRLENLSSVIRMKCLSKMYYYLFVCLAYFSFAFFTLACHAWRCGGTFSFSFFLFFFIFLVIFTHIHHFVNSLSECFFIMKALITIMVFTEAFFHANWLCIVDSNNQQNANRLSCYISLRIIALFPSLYPLQFQLQIRSVFGVEWKPTKRRRRRWTDRLQFFI